jgi:L-threonylcarbamoyladenylate synthase
VPWWEWHPRMSSGMPTYTTRCVAIDPVTPDAGLIAEAAALIRAGELVAFPTETVYGLGADALNPEALSRVYEVKGRPPDNPLILHVANREQLALVASELPASAAQLIDTFWPGALTLVLPKTAAVPEVATGGLSTVAVRMPAHPVALALIAAARTPLAAPSANRSGRPSPTMARHVFDDLHGRIPLILDAGPTPIGLESTVLDMTCMPAAILRPGGVPQEAITAVIGRVQAVATLAQRRRSPGTRYRHYSPRARVLLVEATQTEMLQATVAEALRRGERVGCLLHRIEAGSVPSDVPVTRVDGSVTDYARGLFSALRALDALGLDTIVVEGVQEQGLGVAVMDRLRRAASPPRPRTEPTEW